jgi:hypothetical protein
MNPKRPEALHMVEIFRPAPVSATDEKGGLPMDAVRRSAQGLFGLLALVGLLAMFAASAMTIARGTYSYLKVYPTSLATIADPEPVRWLQSGTGITQLVGFVNQHANPDDKVFSFRQSDLVYYARNPVAVYTDNTYADLFRIKSPETLHQALRDRQIRFVAVPPYGLAEINNSAFGALLADPKLARLSSDFNDNRLFEIQSQPASIRMQSVRRVDMRNAPERSKWNASTLDVPIRISLLSAPPVIDRQSTPGSVTLRLRPPLIAGEHGENVLQPWDIGLKANPFTVGNSEFDVRSGLYSFTAGISGDGLVNLYMDVYSRGLNGNVQSTRRLMWSGVLDNESKRINGQFLLQVSDSKTNPSSISATSARVFFGLKHARYLTVYDLDISRAEQGFVATGLIAEQTAKFEALQRALESGWSHGSGTNVSPAGFGMNEAGTLNTWQTSGAPAGFQSPDYLLPSEQTTPDEATKLSRTAQGVLPLVTHRIRAGGNGRLTATLKGVCLEPHSITIENPMGEREFLLTLSTMSLRTQTVQFQHAIQLPCMPLSLGVQYALDRDILKSPPDKRLGDATLSDVDLTLQVWDAARQLSIIDLVKSSEVRPLVLASPPVALPTTEF